MTIYPNPSDWTLLRPAEFCARHPEFRLGTIRRFIHGAKEVRGSGKDKRSVIPPNGFEHAMIRPPGGRRGVPVYIIEHKFFQWLAVRHDPELLEKWVQQQKAERRALVA